MAGLKFKERPRYEDNLQSVPLQPQRRGGLMTPFTRTDKNN